MTGSGISRRTAVLGGLGTFAAGVAGGYLTDLGKVVRPPGEIADESSSEPAVRGTVLLERLQDQQGELWVFPYRISGRPDVAEMVARGLPSDEERIRSYYNNGAVDANVTRIKLILEGRRNTGTRVLGMRAHLEKIGPPLDNCSVLTPGPQGGGDSALVGFDLDSTNLAARKIDDSTMARDVYSNSFFRADEYFATTTVGLNRYEQQVFQITARTVRHYVEWYVEVTVLDGDRPQSLRFGVNDRPIRTSALYADDAQYPVQPLPDRYAEIYVDTKFSGEENGAETASERFVRQK